MSFFKARFREPSTWAGLAAVLSTAAQMSGSPVAAVVGAIVSGAAAVFVPEAVRPGAPPAAPPPAAEGTR